MKLPLGKNAAVGEAGEEGSWVFLLEAAVPSRMLYRELITLPKGGGEGHRP